jgi:hypothetical protein
MLRMAKVTCFLSYVGDRHNINTSNIMKNKLYLRGTVTNRRGRIKEGEYGWCTLYTRMNTEFFQPIENHHKKGTKVERRKIEGINQFKL